MCRIALTFDDGPSDWTGPILDLLAAYDARATFFVIGSHASDRSDVLRRIVAEGHEVGNHTWSHPRLASDCTDDRVHDELERTNEALTSILGFAPTRFRAPQYDVDDRVCAIAASLGMTHTRGDVRPPDWDPRCTAAFSATLILQQAAPGVVVGQHDGMPPETIDSGADRQATVDAVAVALPRLRERGFECVTASELLGAGAAP